MSVGQTLAAARAAAGLSLAQVSERTRVREDVLAGIERDDFAGCRGDSYARGHIRAYAAVVGVPAEPLLEEFSAGRPPDPHSGQPVLPVPAEPVPRRGLGGLIVVGLLVLMVLVVAWTMMGREPAPAAPAGSVRASPPASAGVAAASAAPASRPSGGVHLR